MALEKITFNHKINSSVQIGDSVYYAVNNFGVLSDPNFAGTIFDLDHSSITVDVVNVGSIPLDSFIMFEKNIKVNESGIKGYYADVTMENRSKKRAELFAVSSEVSPSSK